MQPEHPLGADRVAAFDAAWAAMPKGKPAPPPPPPLELALPGGHTWWIRRTPDPTLIERWQASLRRQGATVETWALLLAAYDAGWDVSTQRGKSVPSPSAMKSAAGWNKVPPPIIEALVGWVAAEAAGALSEAGLDG